MRRSAKTRTSRADSLCDPTTGFVRISGSRSEFLVAPGEVLTPFGHPHPPVCAGRVARLHPVRRTRRNDESSEPPPFRGRGGACKSGQAFAMRFMFIWTAKSKAPSRLAPPVKGTATGPCRRCTPLAPARASWWPSRRPSAFPGPRLTSGQGVSHAGHRDPHARGPSQRKRSAACSSRTR